MSEVRFGVVGYGNIGQTHAATLLSNEVSHARLTGVVSSSQQELPDSVRQFTTLAEMLSSGTVDAVIVATPTMDHHAAGLQVLAAGKHLVMEKPLATSTADAADLIARKPTESVAAVMLNQRYHPAYRAIKKILESDQLGRLVRFNWIMTTWYRPDVYFLVSSWRGTWQGEGGGVLINQCIHNIDVMQWLLGQPDSVVCEAKFGKYHNIEVEDEATALFSYESGLTGVLVASSGEAPGRNLLDIVGEQGTLSFDGTDIVIQSTDQNVAEHCATTQEMFGMPEFTSSSVSQDVSVNQHACVLNDVVAAILHGEDLATPLAEGLNSLEIANAMLLSTWLDKRVQLPVDAELFAQELGARQEKSKLRDPQNIEVSINMDSSYR